MKIDYGGVTKEVETRLPCVRRSRKQANKLSEDGRHGNKKQPGLGYTLGWLLGVHSGGSGERSELWIQVRKKTRKI